MYFRVSAAEEGVGSGDREENGRGFEEGFWRRVVFAAVRDLMGLELRWK